MTQYWLKLFVVIIVSTVMLFYPLHSANSLAAIIYHLKEFVLDVIARLIARSLLSAINKITVETVGKIGRSGGAIIKDWVRFQQAGQYRGENLFRNMLAKSDICDYLKNPVFSIFNINPNSALTAGNPGSQRINNIQQFGNRARCNTNLSAADIDTFRNDFSRGGWDVWGELINPKNNLYGIIGASIEELQQQRNFAENTDTNEGTSGGGFLSNRKDRTLEGCAMFGLTSQCIVWKNIQSTGQNIKDSMSNISGSERDWVTDVDELAEAISAALANVVADMLWNSAASFFDPNRNVGEDYPPENLNQDAQQQCVDQCIASACANVKPLEICELVCIDETRTQDPVSGEETAICGEYEETCVPDPADTSVQNCKDAALQGCQEQCPLQEDFSPN
ncbi:MAG: hypothetical protein Q8Q06_01805 [bacterium]|nr:hypothetical protein [bacterium]